MHDYLARFGFGQPTGIDLPAEAPGLVPGEKWKRITYGERWTTGDTYNMSIGQGSVLATPLQVVQATAAVANGGTLYQPQLVLELLDDGGAVVQPFEASVLARLMATIEARRDSPSGRSYTAQLLAGGVAAIGAKVTEEAAERLFTLADTPHTMARLSPEEIERAIYPAGFYRVNWNGDRLPSGVYFYKLNAGDLNEVRQMVLLK